MQQGSGAGGTATLTDEQILGLDDGLDAANVTGGGAAGQGTVARTGAAATTGTARDSLGADAITSSFADVVMAGNGARVAERLAQLSGAAGADHPDAVWPADAADAASGAGEAEPAWVKTLETQPGAAAEARQWRDAARDISSIDSAYFSAEPGARAGLAERLYQSDPAAFRAMVAESARMLAARDPQGLAELARQLGMPEAAQPLRPRSISQAARQATGSPAPQEQNEFSPRGPQAQPAAGAQADLTPTRQSNPGSSGSQARAVLAAREAEAHPGASSGPQFPAEAYRAFEASTNEDVGRRMREAIGRTLASTLPEGIAEGARRRIGEDVFREVHASLASDRELSRRVGETLRDWRFDASARQQVVALLAGRARAVLPEVARRVVSEWTSSVLASDRARIARIDAAAARRDITGGRLPEPVSSAGLRPREVDYRRLSDEQILEM